jgi:hypothetical protein
VSWEKEMMEITNSYDENDFQRQYHLIMSEPEFNFQLIQNCKTDMQRSICKDLLEIRPGWINNKEVAMVMERFIIEGTLWGYEKASDKDFVQAIIESHAVDQLDAVAAVDILNKHRDQYRQQVSDYAKNRRKQ